MALDNLPKEYHPLINEALREYAEGTKGNYDTELAGVGFEIVDENNEEYIMVCKL